MPAMFAVRNPLQSGKIMKRAFKQVDVFTSVPFKGNPVAVVMDGSGLTTQQMQTIAHWTNLSETTFVLSAEDERASYRVRIFTPGSELPFAGHPTIGTASALLEAGLITPEDGKIVQECAAGLITLDVSQEAGQPMNIAFTLPEPEITLLTQDEVEKLEKALNCQIDRSVTPALVDVGARWIVAKALSPESVLQAKPDYVALAAADGEKSATGTCLFAAYDSGSADIEVRSFAPACGVNEDPVCGSGNGSVAAFMRFHRMPLLQKISLLSSQGQKLGRAGRVHLDITPDAVKVGGAAVTCIDGHLTV